MTVKIYGAIQAECTQRIALVCHELGVSFDLVTVDLVNKQQKTPEWLTNFQPFGQIPVLEDEDGFRVFESRAICRFLAEKYGDTKLLPTGLKERAIFEQAASVEQSYFNASAGIVVGERYIRKSVSSFIFVSAFFSSLILGLLMIRFGMFSLLKGCMNLPTDEDRANQALDVLRANILGYERILSRQSYLAGDELTLADLFHLPIGHLLGKVGVDVLVSEDTPNVARWWKEVSSRESRKAVQAEVENAGPLAFK